MSENSKSVRHILLKQPLSLPFASEAEIRWKEVRSLLPSLTLSDCQLRLGDRSTWFDRLTYLQHPGVISQNVSRQFH